MRFQPKTEQQIDEENLLPAGTYDAEILEAEEAVSKKGNDMIKLRVKVYDQSGSHRFVFDYLLESFPRKLRHAADACGLMADYDLGTLDAGSFVGQTCRVEVALDPAKDSYPAKNTIRDYITEKPAAPARTKVTVDDDIPF